jgi:hypothetical protein
MAGVAVGTPVATKDGSSIMTTHTVSGKGHFSVFNYPDAGDTVKVNFTYTIPAKVGSLPFGAVGYFHSPTEGNFPEGVGNTNDLFMWSAATPANATTVGDGQLFAFQKPMVNPLAINATELSVTLVGNGTQFQAPNAPVFSNGGYLMYISAMQSTLRYWAGSGFPRDQFDRGSKASKGFERGLPKYIAARAPPTVDSDPTAPRVYGPSAFSEIFGCSTDISDCIQAATPAPLSNKVLVSPDKKYVYYGVGDALTQVLGSSLAKVWNVTLGTGMNTKIEGEIAQSVSGRVIYVPVTAGVLYAYQVMANSTAPTSPPLEASDMPSENPSLPPTTELNAPTPSAPVKAPSPVKPPQSDSVTIPIRSYLGILAASLMTAIMF